MHITLLELQLYLQANRSMHAVVAAHEEYIRPWNINVSLNQQLVKKIIVLQR